MYLLKEKSDVEEIFKNFYTMVQTQFQGQIQVFRSDNGKEYFNKFLGHFFFFPPKRVLFIKVLVMIPHNKMELPNEKTSIS